MIETLIALVIICIVAYAAYWVITTFFPEPIRVIALLIVGLLVLVAILRHFSGTVL